MSEQTVKRSGRPYIYLESSTRSKETIAQTIADRDRVTEGLICVLGCVEPCQTFAIRKDSKTKKLKVTRCGKSTRRVHGARTSVN